MKNRVLEMDIPETGKCNLANAAGAMRSTAMFSSSNAVFGSTGGMHPTATSVISASCINLCRHN